MKNGTTTAAAHSMKTASTSGVRHGNSNKNVTTGGKSAQVMGKGVSGGTTAPIKGRDRGGVR